MTDNMKIIGAYVQTELAHGSNVPGLETTAVFDKETDEFVINTPTVSGVKNWAGSLGIHATHAIIMA